MGQQVRYGRRRSHGAGALIAAVILVVAALIAAWTLLPRLFTPRETSRTAEEAYCAAVSSDGARRTLTPDQAQNAALIANIAVTRGLPDHAATVAIATAMQESRLTNLDYGDLDSLGLFQQRPSQGWGTAEQVSDMTLCDKHLLRSSAAGAGLGDDSGGGRRAGGAALRLPGTICRMGCDGTRLGLGADR